MLRRTTLAALLLALAITSHAQTHYVYYVMSEMTNGTLGAPWPMNPCPNCPTYFEGNGIYWVNDLNSPVGYLSSASATEAVSPVSDSGDTNTVSSGAPSGDALIENPNFNPSSDLWIQITNIDSDGIHLVLHNKSPNVYCQWLGTTNLLATNWSPGQILFDLSGPTDEFFAPVALVTNNPVIFFRGEQSSNIVYISAHVDAYATNSTLGIPNALGYVVFSPETPLNDHSVTVYYTLSGTARNGIDYTNLPGSIVIQSNETTAFVYVQPIDPSALTNPIESVIFTLQPNPNYLIDANSSAPNQSVLIYSSTTTVSVSSNNDAVRPVAPGLPGYDGQFQLNRNDVFGKDSEPLTVYYQMTGSATDGVDYQLLSDSITLQPGADPTNISIVPLAENSPQGIKTVTITLVSSNGYVADPGNYSATINILDETNTVGISGETSAINLNGPPGEPAQDGSFTIKRDVPEQLLYPPLTVNYKMSGDASNGVDYSFVGNSVTFSNGQSSATITIHPISAWTNQFKTVTMTLLPGDYVIDSNNVDVGTNVATTVIQNSSTELLVQWQQDPIEAQGTNAVAGVFSVSRNDNMWGNAGPLTVFYSLTGSATNGIDYTNLSGVINFAAGQGDTNIVIQPLFNSVDPGDKTVIISLIPQTYYFIDTNNASTNLLILDSNQDVVFQTVTNGPGQPQQPTGIEYDPFLTNLVLSWEGGFLGSDFDRLGTNITRISGNTVTNLLFANWSTINGLHDEVYLAIVTNGTSSAFTNGDMFFGSDTGIGWLSSNAAASNLNWCVLTNSTQTNMLLLRGGLCIDATGAFSNNIIAVTSGLIDDSEDQDSLPKGVWEVDSHAHATLLTNISASLLEGVTVLPANFGPWSHKIITGDEDSGSLYIIDTNGALTTIDSTNLFRDGIHCESITMIPTNQSLYLCDPSRTGGQNGLIVKLPKSFLANYAGDLLIEDGGEADSPAKLFIINWDPASSNYVARRILYNFGSQLLEGAAFAPIELPAQ